MWSLLGQLKLIRYLIVCRVNRSLVRLPSCLSGELSVVLGSAITNRLPTTTARAWRKAMAPWNEAQPDDSAQDKFQAIPEATWPVESVLLAYPGKAMYGPGELILWELKLLGEQADHALFLEVILPALEEISGMSNSPWYQPHSLWGRFDIHAIYAARGATWEPVVSDSKLNLRYRATPTQWAEGLTFGLNLTQAFNTLTWLAPFDLTKPDGVEANVYLPRPPKKIAKQEIPLLNNLLEALLARIAHLLPGKYTTTAEVWNLLSTEEQLALVSAIEQASSVALTGHSLKPPSKYWPGRWIGSQTFETIPFPLIPYLELASILHLGRQAHFGCGTFYLQ